MKLIFVLLHFFVFKAYCSDQIQAHEILEEGRSVTEYNVKNWGATGDGETDDFASLKKAIDSQVPYGKVILYFPAGKYKISQTLKVSGSKKGSFDKFKFLIQGAGAKNTELFVTNKNKDTLHIESGSKKEFAQGFIKDLTIGPVREITDKGLPLTLKKLERFSMQNIVIPGGQCNVRTIDLGHSSSVKFDAGDTSNGFHRSNCIRLQ